MSGLLTKPSLLSAILLTFAEAAYTVVVTHLLHISDLHFGPKHDPAAAQALLALVKKLPLDALVVSGDLTQRAKESEFRAAAAFLARLRPLPTLCVPGNHDVPLYRAAERLFAPFARYKKHISRELEPTLRLPGATLLGINTYNPMRATVRGSLSARQRRRLHARLTAEAEQLGRHSALAVVGHHHFIPNPSDERMPTLRSANKAIELLLRSRVELVLGGHIHESHIARRQHAPQVMQAAGAVETVFLHSGTTTSHRGRGAELERNSCNLLSIHKERIEVRVYQQADPDPHFRPISAHTLMRRSMK